MPVIDVATDRDNLTMTIVAEFAHPVDRVWQAYTDPRQLERFWGPPAYPATFTAWNGEVGGRAEYHMTGPRGERFFAVWEFLEIEEGVRFAVLDSFADESGTINVELPSTRMVFTFEGRGAGTRLTTVSHLGSLEALEQLIAMGAIEGTTLAMGQIDAVLAGLRAYAQGRGTRVELLTETGVRITRLIEGPRAIVWRAHHDPALLRRWLLGPDGWEMTTCEPSSTVRGTYRWAWTPLAGTEGEPFGFEGEVLLIDEPSRAVTTERMMGTDGPETVNDLNLFEEDGATLITTVIEYPDREIRDMILATGMVDGMEASYARLERAIG